MKKSYHTSRSIATFQKLVLHFSKKYCYKEFLGAIKPPFFNKEGGVAMEDQIQTEIKTSRRSFLNILLGLVLLAGFGGVIKTVLSISGLPKKLLEEDLLEEQRRSHLRDSRWRIEDGPSSGKTFCRRPHRCGIYAVNAVCTHLGCIVYWDKDKKVLACPCHTAFFALNGSVISGPPPSPLPVAQVKIVGDQIIVS